MRMVRTPCCDKESVKKGTWSTEEDATLKSYVDNHGAITNWIALPQKIGLNRCGKSCRLRWLNYLRPDIKRGKFTEEEDKIIADLYFSIGSRWSVMADKLPGRTDNDIKNYWHTKLKRKIVGNQKKMRKRASFRGLNGGLDANSSPSAFTITNGHLMSTTWPPTSQLHNLQDIVGCAAVNDGGDLRAVEQEQQAPITLSFSTNNATTATCSCGGGGGANSAIFDLPPRNIIGDHQPMVGQFYFGNPTAIISSGVSGGAANPPMNIIIDDHPPMARQFCFHENGSSGSSYDLMTTMQDMHETDIDMDMDMNIYGYGSTSTSPEVLNASLKELQDSLFNDLPTPSTSATTSSFCLLPVEDNNNKVDLLDNSNHCQDNFLWQDILDQFS